MTRGREMRVRVKVGRRPGKMRRRIIEVLSMLVEEA